MDFLKELGIESINAGACWGNNEWSTTQDQGIIESTNPANGELIAKVYAASEKITRQSLQKQKNLLLSGEKYPHH